MQRKIKEEDMRVLRGDVQLDENDLEDSLLDDVIPPIPTLVPTRVPTVHSL